MRSNPRAAIARLAAAIFGLAAAATVCLALEEASIRWGNPAWRPAVPADPSAYEDLAEQEPDQAGEAAQQWWRKAVALNPRSSAAWIALGLEAERQADLPEAERDFLAAARVDHQYLPAWTLANFYFRRGDDQNFWPWAQRAARLCYGDLTPLAQLCDRFAPHRMLAGPAGVGNDSGNLDRAYFDWLIREHRLDDAHVVARRMLAAGPGADLGRLIAFTTFQIEAGHGDAAREIWDRLFPARVASDGLLTNGEFRTEPSGQGFDWNTPPTEGVRRQWRQSRMRFFLSGRQPETCVLLEQPLVFEPRWYSVHAAYSISGPGWSGLHWVIDPEAPQTESPMINPAVSDGAWRFRARRSGLARLRLIYRREAGSPLIESEVELRHVRLDSQ